MLGSNEGADLTSSTMPRGEMLAICAQAFMDHRQTIMDTLRKALSPNPNSDIGVVVIQVDGNATVIATDRAELWRIADQPWPDGNLTKVFREELDLFFTPPPIPGKERMLFVDVRSGIVCRYRFACTVRDELRTNAHMN